MTKVNKKELFIVGIGASAGGIDALSNFLGHLPIEEGVKEFCILVIQHLNPDYPSELTGVLSKKSHWEVVKVENGTVPRAGKVYVTPHNCDVFVEKGQICLDLLKSPRRVAPSIDKCFFSMAKEYGDRSIGVVLSGFGDDGTKGAKAIRDARGTIIVQHPQTAQQPDMPQAVISTNEYDSIVAPADMYDEILLSMTNQRLAAEHLDYSDKLENIFALLEERTGTDFTKYKSTTIMRRLDKRVESLEMDNLAKYYDYLKETPDELEELFQTVLIGVTDFFRDEESFESLHAELKNQLVKVPINEAFRIWSVGCATGEEPYTIAILLHEILGEAIQKRKVQIFASDLDEKALAKARKGVYDASSLENMPAEIKEKYFEKTEKGYEVKKILKQMVLFSKHDITIDPPFVKLNCIVCRNLLIYFNNDLQKETLKIFHYSLKNDGLLFLGKSESVSVMQELFDKQDVKHKIFRRAVGNPLYPLLFSKFRGDIRGKKRPKDKPSNHLSLMNVAKETLFEYYENPLVIINEHAEIKQIRGSVRLYLEVSEGSMSANLLKMVNKEMVLELNALLTKVKKSKVTEASSIIKFHLFDQIHYVRIKILPLAGQNAPGYFMVIFEKINLQGIYKYMDRDVSPEDYNINKIDELEHELASAREHLQTLTEELESSNEELQSLNEELQSANEELKSSNEELETSNEELQSANEELSAANSELRISNDNLLDKERQLIHIKDELEHNQILYRAVTDNLPNGTIGILNRDFVMEFVGGQGLDLANLKSDDYVGKKHMFYNPDEGTKQKIWSVFRDTFNHGVQQQLTFKYNDLEYILTAIPLQKNGEVDKIMYLTQDITKIKRLSDRLQEFSERFKIIADLTPALIWLYDIDEKFNYFNKEWNSFTGAEDEELKGLGWLNFIKDENRGAYTSALRTALKNKKEYNVEYCLYNVKENGYRWVLDKGVPRFDANGKFLGFIGAAVDINDQKMVEKKKDEFLNVASHELKTPLTSVNAYVQLIEERFEEDNIEGDVKNYIKKASRSLVKLNQLISDLLDVSRLEADKVRIDFHRLNFDLLVRNTVDNFMPTTSHTIIVEGDTNKFIKGDEPRLEQVILNFLSNAVKFSPVDKEIKVSLNTDDKSVWLEVHDQGIGIDKNKMNKIFDRFYQVDEANHTGGIGLGLYISKEIIQRHWGEIYIDSEGVNKGTTIGFRLDTV
ncbi:CheR family methyltransferase [Fulvivirga sediminis]|uniref:PAS domain S-box protein n=1 Tax=Fulvivirga sediminis TaxID=2803949 RepID=A0A937K2G8_9BACT|nr:CheR family methyltransferase [Fulvivirga sediminis]MBL3658360.1 PAS domain S-box protein [Fulvivirga sediminis]